MEKPMKNRYINLLIFSLFAVTTNALHSAMMQCVVASGHTAANLTAIRGLSSTKNIDLIKKKLCEIKTSDINPQQFPNLAKFLQQHGNLTPDVQEALEAYKQTSRCKIIKDKGDIIKIDGNKKSYYVKRLGHDIYVSDVSHLGLNRIIHAHRIRNFIQQNGINQIDVPQKHVTLLEGKWAIIAEEIKGATPSLDLPLTKELARVVEETGIWDLHQENLRIHNNRVFIIDTEVSTHKKNDAIMSFIKKEPHMTDEAKAWLEKHSLKHANTNPFQKLFGVNRIETKKYDDPNISLNQLLDEAKKVLTPSNIFRSTK